MTKRLLIGFFLTFLISCTNNIGPNLDTSLPHYKVYADKAFGSMSQARIAGALQEWASKTNYILEYDLEFVETKDLKRTEDDWNTIYIFLAEPGPGKAGWTSWNTSRNGAYILIAPGVENSEWNFNSVIKHEMGHSFHLVHYNNCAFKSVMHDGAYDTDKIECTDIKAFCDIWHCNIECDLIPSDIIQTPSIDSGNTTCSINLNQ